MASEKMTVKDVLDQYVDAGYINPAYQECFTFNDDGTTIIDLDLLEPLLEAPMTEQQRPPQYLSTK